MEKFLELIYTFLRNAMAVLGDFAASAGLRLLGAAVILFVGFKVTKWVQGILLKSKGIQHLEPGVQTFLKSPMIKSPSPPITMFLYLRTFRLTSLNCGIISLWCKIGPAMR